MPTHEVVSCRELPSGPVPKGRLYPARYRPLCKSGATVDTSTELPQTPATATRGEGHQKHTDGRTKGDNWEFIDQSIPMGEPKVTTDRPNSIGSRGRRRPVFSIAPTTRRRRPIRRPDLEETNPLLRIRTSNRRCP